MLATVCEAPLIIAVHDPAVHGLGEMDATNVLGATPPPAMSIPTASEPVVMVMESVVLAPLVEPVKSAATPLQKKPAGHGDSEAAPGAQNVPVAHTWGRAEPVGQKEPAGHGNCWVSGTVVSVGQ